MSSADDIQHDLSRARDLGIDTCGRIAEFWGFTRTMGRTFGLLYLSREPLPQTEIQKRLGISAGSASMTLAALGRWGVVHRIWVRGQRREHYQSETDFWKMIAGVLNERERREIGAAVEAVERGETSARAALAAAKAQTGAAGKKLKAEADFTVQRLERLNEILQAGRDHAQHAARPAHPRRREIPPPAARRTARGGERRDRRARAGGGARGA